jgi:hypothetical protein
MRPLIGRNPRSGMQGFFRIPARIEMCRIRPFSGDDLEVRWNVTRSIQMAFLFALSRELRIHPERTKSEYVQRAQGAAFPNRRIHGRASALTFGGFSSKLSSLASFGLPNVSRGTYRRKLSHLPAAPQALPGSSCHKNTVSVEIPLSQLAQTESRWRQANSRA